MQRYLILALLFGGSLWGSCAPDVVAQPTTPTLTPMVEPSPTYAPVPTPIQYSPLMLKTVQYNSDLAVFTEGQAAEYGVQPSLVTYALNNEIAFLHGGLFAPAGYYRSLLLRTEDGGQTWQETLLPEFGSSVLRLHFLEGGEGWALLAWMVEGPGTISLYHTENFGQTWEKVSVVPKCFHDGWPTLFEFYDEFNGLIHMACESAYPNSRVGFFTTTDGGLTWEETDSYSLVNVEAETISEKFERYYNGYDIVRDGSRPLAKDGSRWRINDWDEEDVFFTVSRWLPQDSKWQVVSVLPTRLYMSEGILLPP